MTRRLAAAASVLAAAALVSTAPPALQAQGGSYVYAITGARVVPVSGAVLASGTVVVRDGVIASVSPGTNAPAGAVIVDGKGLTVYPGLIDMGSTTGLDMPPVPRAQNARTTEDVERVKADYLRRAQFRAADHVNPTQQALMRAAAAGITSILATPSGDAIRGQSALISTVLPEDDPQIGAVADERKGALVLRTPVALHVTFSERPEGGNAYPNSLMGVIAFVRQAFVDAQYFQAAQAHAAKQQKAAVRLNYEPALEAMQAALARQLPVAFRGDTSREILRGLAMAREFKLDPLITGGREAGEVIADLKAQNARVILSLDYPKRLPSLAPDADEPLQTLRARANAPKTAASLQQAGIPFAFASEGLSDPKDFVKNAARAVQSGLSREDALRALTLQAATLAGAAARVGSIEAGKLANLVVTDGDLFDEKTTIRHVFVEGRPVDLAAARASENRRATQ